MRFLQGQLANVSGELRVKNPHCIPQPAYLNVSLSVVCEPPPPTPAPTRSVKTDDDVDAAAPSRCAAGLWRLPEMREGERPRGGATRAAAPRGSCGESKAGAVAAECKLPCSGNCELTVGPARCGRAAFCVDARTDEVAAPTRSPLWAISNMDVVSRAVLRI